MKEDILEQLVDDYLQLGGFFTTHNVKFQPAKGDPDYVVAQDCVPSDVDVVGFHPLRKGPDRVWVVSCKSWQGGFNPGEWIISIEKNKRVSRREAWHWFRELVKKKWADALITKIEKFTGSTEFTYVTAVTKLRGGPSDWQQHPPFKRNLRGHPIVILTLQEILTHTYKATSTTLAASEIGRLLQVIKASGWKP